MSKHIVLSESEGSSSIAVNTAPEFLPLDFQGWDGRAVEDSGVFMFLFDIAADAVEFPVHADEAEWLAYVVSGSGEMFSGTPDGVKNGSVEYSAGDYITFRANTQHGWRNGGEPGKILFVKRSGGG